MIASSSPMRRFRSTIPRHLAPYILGCLTGFLLSAFMFHLISPSLAPSRSLHSLYTQPSPQSSRSPLSSQRQFTHTHDGPDDAAAENSIPFDLELNNAAIHANHSTFKLLACVEQRAPPDSAIVPTRSHPSFAITVLFPRYRHATSQALLEHGVDDVHILHVVAPLLHGECGSGVEGRLPGLVVVQQADVGFLGLYAAAVGCPVLLLESRPVMRKALDSTLCANPHLQGRVWVEPLALNEGGKGAAGGMMDRTPVRAYVGLDSEEGDYREEDAEAHFDCSQPSVASKCAELPSTSLAGLLHNSSDVYTHFNQQFPLQNTRPIFLLQLAGDAASVRSLLSSADSLLSAYRVYHILLPFRPHLLGVSLASELLLQMERLGYEVAEVPYIPPESSFSLFQSFKSYLATSFASLASYTRPLRYDEIEGYAEKVFECGDKRGECRVDLVFTLMQGRFVAGIVPYQAQAVAAAAAPAAPAAAAAAEGPADKTAVG